MEPSFFVSLLTPKCCQAEVKPCLVSPLTPTCCRAEVKRPIMPEASACGVREDAGSALWVRPFLRTVTVQKECCNLPRCKSRNSKVFCWLFGLPCNTKRRAAHCACAYGPQECARTFPLLVRCAFFVCGALTPHAVRWDQSEQNKYLHRFAKEHIRTTDVSSRLVEA